MRFFKRRKKIEPYVPETKNYYFPVKSVSHSFEESNAYFAEQIEKCVFEIEKNDRYDIEKLKQIDRYKRSFIFYEGNKGVTTRGEGWLFLHVDEENETYNFEIRDVSLGLKTVCETAAIFTNYDSKVWAYQKSSVNKFLVIKDVEADL